jgi:hypothetical protein
MNEITEKRIEDLLETMDEWIDAWHDGPKMNVSLQRYLGMERAEYSEFVESPRTWAQNILSRQTKDHSKSEI